MKLMKTFLLLVALNVCGNVALPARAADAPTFARKSAIKDVSVAEAEKLVQQTNVVVLDVRTPKEFKDGHIRGATNVNFYESSFRSQLQALDKSKPYLVHCAVGGRSGKAVKTMQELGFTNIYHLEAGMKGWENAKKPVVR